MIVSGNSSEVRPSMTLGQVLVDIHRQTALAAIAGYGIDIPEWNSEQLRQLEPEIFRIRPAQNVDSLADVDYDVDITHRRRQYPVYPGRIYGKPRV